MAAFVYTLVAIVFFATGTSKRRTVTGKSGVITIVSSLRGSETMTYLNTVNKLWKWQLFGLFYAVALLAGLPVAAGWSSNTVGILELIGICIVYLALCAVAACCLMLTVSYHLRHRWLTRSFAAGLNGPVVKS